MNRRLVYTIKRPGDKKPTGLALNCHLWHGAFRYFDMEHGHETIERFRRETYKIVEGGNYIAQVIRSTVDLHEWYRKRYGEAAGLCYPRINSE